LDKPERWPSRAGGELQVLVASDSSGGAQALAESLSKQSKYNTTSVIGPGAVGQQLAKSDKTYDVLILDTSLYQSLHAKVPRSAHRQPPAVEHRSKRRRPESTRKRSSRS